MKKDFLIEEFLQEITLPDVKKINSLQFTPNGLKEKIFWAVAKRKGLSVALGDVFAASDFGKVPLEKILDIIEQYQFNEKEINYIYEGNMLLNLALYYHKIPQLIKLLLDKGANPNKVNKNGSTAIYCLLNNAKESDDKNCAIIVKELLKNGMDPGLPDNEDNPTCRGYELAKKAKLKNTAKILWDNQ